MGMDTVRGEPGKVGRPSKLTPERMAEIVRLLEAGNFRSVAARASGITYTRFKQWMNLGKSHLPEHKAHRAFRKAVIAATARAEAEAVSTVKTLIDKGELKAAAFYLERTRPKRWGRRTQSTVTLTITAEVRQRTLADPDAMEAAFRFLSAVAKPGEALSIADGGPDGMPPAA